MEEIDAVDYVMILLRFGTDKGVKYLEKYLEKAYNRILEGDVELRRGT